MSGADGGIETGVLSGVEVSAPAPLKRICLLVLGMHRSGTSALTRVLSLAGAELPAHLMGASEGNESGHWEPQALVDYHERLLTELGSGWYDWRTVDLNRLTPSRRAEIRSELAALIKAEYGNAKTIVVKDPRICRFARLFIEAAAEAGFECRPLLAFRSPLEVAHSLERRNPSMTRSQTALLWLRHVVDAEAATRGSLRAFVSYDGMMADWRAAFERLTSQINAHWSHNADAIGAGVDEFLSQELRHHSSTAKDVLLDDVMRNWIGEAFSALLTLERRPNDIAATQTLDRIAYEFDSATPLMSRLTVEAEERLAQAEMDLEASRRDANSIAAKSGALEVRLEVERATHEAALAAERATHEATLAAERNAVKRAEAERDLSAEQVEAERAAAASAASEHAVVLAITNRKLNEAESLRRNFEQTAAERAREIEALQQQVRVLTEAEGRARTDIGKMQEWLASIQQDARRLRELVNQRDEQLHAMGSSTSWKLTRPLRGLKRMFTEPEFRRALPYRIARSAARRINLPVTLRARAKALGARLGLIYTGEPVQIAPLATEIAPRPLHHNPARGDFRYRALWVVNDSDLQTQKYRVFTYAEELARHNVESVVVREVELHDIDAMSFDIVIFNRVAANDQALALAARCREAGIPTRYDIDDLVFDVDRMPLLRVTATLVPDAYTLFRNGVAARRKMMLACDVVTTSTAPLAREVRKLGRPAYVVPNTISRADMTEFGGERPPRTGDKVRIAYLSGTKTHEEDFAECAEALADILRERPNAELMIVGELDLPASFDAFGDRIVRRPLMPHRDMLRELQTVDINLAPLELGNAFTACKSELKIFEAALLGVPTIASPTPTFAAVIEHDKTGMLAATRAEWRAAIDTLLGDHKLRQAMGRAAKQQIAPRFSIETTVAEALAIDEALIARRTVALPEPLQVVSASAAPLITVIAILYNKAKEVRFFLEALARQDFGGPYEVLLVNDCSTDDSVAVVEDYLTWYRAGGGDRMSVRVLENETNLGNCGSRNRAVAEAKSDVVVIVDADCMLNHSFLTEHYRAHAHGDCDAAIGPESIETEQEAPFAALGRLEADQTLRFEKARPQDALNPDHFVNCVTRNFSINKRFLSDHLREELFDNRFAYSRDPESGFGWEDVEMGCRLYKAGARLRSLPQTFSIHVSHPSTTGEKTKPLRSLKNFRRLHEKHPDLILLARQWSLRTHAAILDWARAFDLDLSTNEDALFLEQAFGDFRRTTFFVGKPKRRKVLTHRWHCPLQYDHFRNGDEYTMVTGAGTAMCNSWEWDKRPMPPNTRMLHRDQVDFRDYDLALVHFDENALHPERCHGMVPPDWGATLDWFIRDVPLPKVGICHGTPQFIGQYDGSYTKPDLMQVIEESRREMVDYFKNTLVVCNSYQAREEWGFPNSPVLWHGLAPHDYPVGSHRRDVLTMLGAALENRPHYNGMFVVRRVQELIGGKVDIGALKVPNPPESYAHPSQAWAESKFRNYTRTIGEFSIYLNSTLRSPFPRSRGEAMMAGLVSVNMRNHDADMFIENGVNGFYGDSADELAEQILFLKKNPAVLDRMGVASRKTALDLFNQDRHFALWSTILDDVIG